VPAAVSATLTVATRFARFVRLAVAVRTFAPTTVAALSTGPAPAPSFIVGLPPAFAAVRMASAGVRLRVGSTFAALFMGGLLVARRRECGTQLRKYFLQHDVM
jgi:hypothetical protein